jgi:hypothetical protein
MVLALLKGRCETPDRVNAPCVRSGLIATPRRNAN